MNARTVPPREPGVRQRGVALLAAMLTVTLVATLAASALWQQWRAVEVETAERARLQASWVLIGALDWSRLILREDGRAPGADHLAEPWAIALEEARLSTFLSAERNVPGDAVDTLPEAFLSGRIMDAQSKLNVINLVEAGKPVPEAVAAFTKLFGMLGLPAQDLAVMIASLQRVFPAPNASNPTANNASATPTASTAAAAAATPASGAASGAAAGSAASLDPSVSIEPDAPLLPQRMSQLPWLGVSSATARALEPYVTVLPVRTALNINTASAEALFASVPTLDLAGAQRLVAQRSRSFFRTLSDGSEALGTARFVDGQHGVSSSFFETHGRLRIDRTWVDEHSLLRRNGVEVVILWRERGAGATSPGPAR
ncbi:type II secretion system minor pseudopilin GspK [Variovorax sp. PvP013]|uniref:type II secretion system minor pseudopilin GspK n=1 Tax=Variovorax sp. PvP013 TaxID=3156435 RepID=UPI003D1B89CD